MTTTPALSPSRCHQDLARRNRPALAFSGGDVAAWRRQLRRTVRQRLGLHRIDVGTRVPLRVRSLQRWDTADGSIEKILFTCERGADATAFICLPKTARKRHPWLICLQGHSSGAHNSVAVDREDHSKPIVVAGDRDFGITCMRNGVAALCLEQRSFGERRERDQAHMCGHNGCHDAIMHALMLGRTLVGERVFDVDRALDLLWTRDDVDRQRVGVMGNSGGGTVSIYAAALLPRLRFAMPSCAFCTFAASMMAIYHCGDNYIPNLLLDAEMADVLGCFAPKPLVVVNGRTDDIFPIAGASAAMRQLRRIYAAAGAEQHLHHVIGPEGHRFYADLAWKKARRYLLDG